MITSIFPTLIKLTKNTLQIKDSATIFLDLCVPQLDYLRFISNFVLFVTQSFIFSAYPSVSLFFIELTIINPFSFYYFSSYICT